MMAGHFGLPRLHRENHLRPDRGVHPPHRITRLFEIGGRTSFMFLFLATQSSSYYSFRNTYPPAIGCRTPKMLTIFSTAMKFYFVIVLLPLSFGAQEIRLADSVSPLPLCALTHESFHPSLAPHGVNMRVQDGVSE